MANKRIVNGIDVSKCEYYGKYFTYCRIDEELCSGNLSYHCKQLARAKEEIEELKAQLEQQKKENKEFKEKLSQVKDITEPLNSELPEDKVIREIFLIVNDCINEKVNKYKQELEEIKSEFCIESLEDNTTGKRTYRSLTLVDTIRERDELKTKVKYLHSFLKNRYNYGSFRPMWGAYLLKHLFNENLGDFFDEEAYKMSDTIEEKEKQLSRHEQAFVILEDICRNLLDDEYTRNIATCLLDIINKAKDGE